MAFTPYLKKICTYSQGGRVQSGRCRGKWDIKEREATLLRRHDVAESSCQYTNLQCHFYRPTHKLVSISTYNILVHISLTKITPHLPYHIQFHDSVMNSRHSHCQQHTIWRIPRCVHEHYTCLCYMQ